LIPSGLCHRPLVAIPGRAPQIDLDLAFPRNAQLEKRFPLMSENLAQ
jgi:hypothetical protein